MKHLRIVLFSLGAALASPALASSYEVQAQKAAKPVSNADNRLEQFTPRTTDPDHKIDYSIWGDALQSFVVGMGPSLREGAPWPDVFTGTRFNRGHNSRLRYEGSRIAYSFFTDEITASLTEYRQDLERVGTEVNIASLSRNEQLAFWLNLHNVAIIEQIARNYPKVVPSLIEIDDTPLDEARFIEVAGVKLSPRDIRTRIVYPNWSDPRVVYGFFRGDIGGPMIQPEEFNAGNLDFLLADNAGEFVNSLRGVERRGDRLLVSRIYEEAAPFYFSDLETDLPAHIASFAEEEVTKHLEKADRIEYSLYEKDIADLARGQRQPYVPNVTSLNRYNESIFTSTRIPLNVMRYVTERQIKIDRLKREGVPTWTVRVVPIDLPDGTSNTVEID